MTLGTAGDRLGVLPPPAARTPREPEPARESLFVLDPGLSRFAGLLLVYVTLLAALATLSPFDFDWQRPHGYQLGTGRTDIALNLGLLFPAGFLWRLARPGRRVVGCFDALVLGLGLSLLLESLQSFLPSRVPSPIDVVTNGFGAWAGAYAHSLLGPWLDRRLQKQLSLHLPLANVLYLLVPLCSLDSLCLGSRLECVFVLPLAAFMAAQAAGLYKHRLLAAQGPFALRYSLAIGALFAIGYLPVGAHDSLAWALLGLAAALLTGATIAVPTRLGNSERRFVLVTMRRASPWFVLYLVGLACRSWLQHASGTLSDGRGQGGALVLLRDVAAFTLLGYLVSELHARSPLSLRRLLARCAGLAVLPALLLVAARGADRELGTVGLLLVAAFAGTTIHRAQLRLVRSWGHSIPPRSAVRAGP
jgi:glycopeptide antibiotics resistance protein